MAIARLAEARFSSSSTTSNMNRPRQWFGDRGWRSDMTPLPDYLRAHGRPVPSPDSDAGVHDRHDQPGQRDQGVRGVTSLGDTVTSRQLGYAMLTSAKLACHNIRGDYGACRYQRILLRLRASTMTSSAGLLLVAGRWAYRCTIGAVRRISSAARSGFAELTRIAREQCDAWTGLAAAGDTSAAGDRGRVADGQDGRCAAARDRPRRRRSGVRLRHRAVPAVRGVDAGRLPAGVRRYPLRLR